MRFYFGDVFFCHLFLKSLPIKIRWPSNILHRAPCLTEPSTQLSRPTAKDGKMIMCCGRGGLEGGPPYLQNGANSDRFYPALSSIFHPFFIIDILNTLFVSLSLSLCLSVSVCLSPSVSLSLYPCPSLSLCLDIPLSLSLYLSPLL